MGDGNAEKLTMLSIAEAERLARIANGENIDTLTNLIDVGKRASMPDLIYLDVLQARFFSDVCAQPSSDDADALSALLKTENAIPGPSAA